MKLSRRAKQKKNITPWKKFQKNEKTFQKPIDKMVKMWYNNKVAAKKATIATEAWKKVEKNLKKFWKTSWQSEMIVI